MGIIDLCTSFHYFVPAITNKIIFYIIGFPISFINNYLNYSFFNYNKNYN